MESDHDDRSAGGGAGAVGAGAGPLDSAEDDSDSESEDSLPDDGLPPEPSGDIMLEQKRRHVLVDFSKELRPHCLKHMESKTFPLLLFITRYKMKVERDGGTSGS